jgi:hypothetical protein
MKVPMILTLVGPALLGVFAWAQEPTPQPPAAAGQKQARRQALLQLRDDFDRAIANAKLTDAEKKEVDDARAALRATGKQRRQDAPDQAQRRAALKTIQKYAHHEGVRAEDREALQKSLRALRDQRPGHQKL